jgi:MFS family permease
MEGAFIAAEQRRLAHLEGNIWRVYVIFLLFCSFAFAVPVCVLIWRESGLSMSDALLLQVGFATVWALSEVPTGYLADAIGRKRSIGLGAMLGLAGALVYLLADSFLLFLLAEMFLGVGLALASGADMALLYDSLLELGREQEFEKLAGRRQAFALVGTSAFAIVGGYLAEESLMLPLYLAVAGKLLVFPFVLGLVEPGRPQIGQRRSSLAAIKQVLGNCLRHDRRIRWLIMFPALLFGLLQVVLWLYQPYFELLGLEKRQFGLLFAAFNIVAAIAAHYASAVHARLSDWVVVVLPLALITASYLLMSYVLFSLGFVFIFLHQLVRGYMSVVFPADLNRRVSSDLRATALSVQNFVYRVVYVMLLLGIGSVIDALGTLSTLKLLGMLTPVLGLLAAGLFYQKGA